MRTYGVDTTPRLRAHTLVGVHESKPRFSRAKAICWDTLSSALVEVLLLMVQLLHGSSVPAYKACCQIHAGFILSSVGHRLLKLYVRLRWCGHGCNWFGPVSFSYTDQQGGPYSSKMRLIKYRDLPKVPKVFALFCQSGIRLAVWGIFLNEGLSEAPGGLLPRTSRTGLARPATPQPARGGSGLGVGLEI